VTVTEDSPPGALTVPPPRGTNRLFAAGSSARYADHVATYGAVALDPIGPALITSLDASGLTGRGGAGFPAWRKFAATRAGRSGLLWSASAVVVGNGAEGEPRSLKDETLLNDAPHLVIDGLLIAARAVSASRLYLYLPVDSYPPVLTAISERRDARNIVLVQAPETFISGEASAVVNAIENGIALPVDRVRRLSESGYKRHPTLVHNVESLAHIALIARFGARWFRSEGSDLDPGTRLVTVSGDVGRERVMEVAGDTPLVDVLRACGTEPESLAAVLVGGYHGTWVPAAQLSLPLSAGGLAPLGGQPGAGVIVALGRHRCGLHATAEIVDYLAKQSAGQCGPCMFGLPALAEKMRKIAAGDRDPRGAAELKRLGDSITGRGACHHPDGTARLVSSALAAFAADVVQHRNGRCVRAGSVGRGNR
jgi:NADH:ubiquinone oxidoreductase subunit F (NADH-binding)